MNRAHVELVDEWPAPAGVGQADSFKGLVEYFKRFVRHANHTGTADKCDQEGRCNFFWDAECEASLSEVEPLLSTAPILAMLCLQI